MRQVCHDAKDRTPHLGRLDGSSHRCSMAAATAGLPYTSAPCFRCIDCRLLCRNDCLDVCVSLYRYFSRAWRNRRRVPNRTEYVVWLGLETLAAVGVVIAVLYGYSRL